MLVTLGNCWRIRHFQPRKIQCFSSQFVTQERSQKFKVIFFEILGVKIVMDFWWQVFCWFSPGRKGLKFVTENFTTFFTSREENCHLELTLGESSPKVCTSWLARPWPPTRLFWSRISRPPGLGRRFDLGLSSNSKTQKAVAVSVVSPLRVFSIDDRQIAHLICVRLKLLLYDFLGFFLGLLPVVFLI